MRGGTLDATSPATDKETRAARRPSRRSWWRRNENWILGSLSMLAFLCFWEIAVRAGAVNPLFTSSPSRIVTTGFAMFADGSIYEHLQASGTEFFAGFAAAGVVGVARGILVGCASR